MISGSNEFIMSLAPVRIGASLRLPDKHSGTRGRTLVRMIV